MSVTVKELKYVPEENDKEYIRLLKNAYESQYKRGSSMVDYEDFKDYDAFALTEWGCLNLVLTDYNIDASHITGRMGAHLVDDFMELMCKCGYVLRKDE